jgi:hypothetical protein
VGKGDAVMGHPGEKNFEIGEKAKRTRQFLYRGPHQCFPVWSNLFEMGKKADRPLRNISESEILLRFERW